MTNQIRYLPIKHTYESCQTNRATQLSSDSEITNAIQKLLKNVSHSDTAKSIRELLQSNQKNVPKVVLSTLIEAEINRLNQQPDANRATHIRELLSITCDTLHPPDLIRFVENEIDKLNQQHQDNPRKKNLMIFYLINCVLSALEKKTPKYIADESKNLTSIKWAVQRKILNTGICHPLDFWYLEPSLKNIDTLNLRIENIFSIYEKACDHLLNFDIG